MKCLPNSFPNYETDSTLTHSKKKQKSCKKPSLVLSCCHLIASHWTPSLSLKGIPWSLAKHIWNELDPKIAFCRFLMDFPMEMNHLFPVLDLRDVLHATLFLQKTLECIDFLDLKELHLSRSNVSDSDCCYYLKGVFPRLTCLDLSYTQITQKGLNHLMRPFSYDPRKRNVLQRLDVEGIKIHDLRECLSVCTHLNWFNVTRTAYTKKKILDHLILYAKDHAKEHAWVMITSPTLEKACFSFHQHHHDDALYSFISQNKSFRMKRPMELKKSEAMRPFLMFKKA